jgi:hypothetical protein
MNKQGNEIREEKDGQNELFRLENSKLYFPAKAIILTISPISSMICAM